MAGWPGQLQNCFDGTVFGEQCGNFGTDFCGITGGIPLGTCLKVATCWRHARWRHSWRHSSLAYPMEVVDRNWIYAGGENWSAIDLANAAAISS